MSGFGDDSDDAWATTQQHQEELNEQVEAPIEEDFNNLALQDNAAMAPEAAMNQFEDDDFGSSSQPQQQFQQMDERASWNSLHHQVMDEQEEGGYVQQQHMAMGTGMMNGGDNRAVGSAFYGAGSASSGFHHEEQQVPESVRQYQTRHMAELQEREQLNEEKQHTTLQAAQAYLDAFHQDRHSKIEAHLSQIKQQESSFFSTQETLKHSNPWAAVVELSDLHKMTEPKSKLALSSSSAGTGSLPANAAVAVMSSSASVSSSSSRPGSAMGSPIVGATSTESVSLLVNRHQKDVSRMKQLLIELKNTAVATSS